MGWRALVKRSGISTAQKMYVCCGGSEDESSIAYLRRRESRTSKGPVVRKRRSVFMFEFYCSFMLGAQARCQADTKSLLLSFLECSLNNDCFKEHMYCKFKNLMEEARKNPEAFLSIIEKGRWKDPVMSHIQKLSLL